MYAINGMPKETSLLHQNQPEDVVDVECVQKLIAYGVVYSTEENINMWFRHPFIPECSTILCVPRTRAKT